MRSLHVAKLTYCLALGAVGPLTAGGVVCSAFLALQPPGSPTLPVAVAAAPYLVGAVGAGLALGSRYMARAAFITVIATSMAGNAAMLIVLKTYWGARPSSEDYGWPVTDLAIFSLVLGAGVVLGLLVAAQRSRR